MNEQQNEPGHEVVIDPLRAPAHEDRAQWEADAARTVGQLVAEGVERKEAERRIRKARRRLKEEARRAAVLESLIQDRAEKRKTTAGRPSRLGTGNAHEGSTK